MTNIYNLFKFIEDKEGYTTPLQSKLIYAPSTITPDDLIINGDLNLSKTKITKLPDNLTVNGNLDLTHSKITKLPDNLTVGGNLALYYTKMTSFPHSLIVDGSIILFNTQLSKKYTKEQLKQMLPGVKGNIFV